VTYQDWIRKQYANYRRSYWHMERMHAELAEVYGYTATPRMRSNGQDNPRPEGASD